MTVHRKPIKVFTILGTFQKIYMKNNFYWNQGESYKYIYIFESEKSQQKLSMLDYMIPQPLHVVFLLQMKMETKRRQNFIQKQNTSNII